jgi:hypothetical protein
VRTFFFLFPVFAGPFFWQSMLVCFACWIPLAVCCRRSSQYSRATETVLREYGNKLRAHLLRQQQQARI